MRTPISILLVLGVAAATSGCSGNYRHHYTVKYPDITFSTSAASSSRFGNIPPSQFTAFSTGWRLEGNAHTGYRVEGEVAEIYVKLRDKVYFLPDFPEATAKELCEKRRPATTFDPKEGSSPSPGAVPEDSAMAGSICYYDSSGSLQFHFKDGRLKRFLASSSADEVVLFSNRKEGRFHWLPISEENMISMFGKPTKRSKSTSRIRGCMDLF